MLATRTIAWRPYVLCFLILFVIYKIESTWRLASLRLSFLAYTPHLLARNISATELLSRPLATDITTIPKILHQSWKSRNLPFRFQQWSEGCRGMHPDWEWVLWTDDDNLRLVRKYYPWLEKTYRALPAGIYRADLVRSLYMYTFGGVYLDLDTDCLQPSEVLFKSYIVSRSPPIQTALLGRMGNNPDFEHSIPNAWMASTPAHPFFLVLPAAVDNKVQDGKVNGAPPEYLTGPVALRDSIAVYEMSKITKGNDLGENISRIRQWFSFPNNQTLDHQVVLLPSDLIYPYSWGGDGKLYEDLCWVLKDTYNADRCKAVLEVERKGSVCIAYWSHNHGPERSQNGEKLEKNIT